VASRVQTAVTMRQVTGSMAGVVRGMEGAMKAMDLDKVRFPLLRILLWFLSRFTLGAPHTLSLTNRSLPTQISAVMDKFETQFEDLDVATGYYETATSSATAVGTPQDDVDKLMHLAADEVGVELNAEMKAPETGVPTSKVGAEEEREEGLGERLRALRN